MPIPMFDDPHGVLNTPTPPARESLIDVSNKVLLKFLEIYLNYIWLM